MILCGESRALLNWVAYAMAASNPGGFVWTEIQLDGEVRDERDLLRTDRIPRDRYFEVPPNDLLLDELAGNVAVGGLARSGDPHETIRGFADFLRLPPHVQRLISRLPQQGPPAVLVISNGHRISGFYSWETAGPSVRAILRAGASLLVTWAEAPTQGRLQFEHVLHLTGGSPASWRDAALVVERATPGEGYPTGTKVPLRDWPEVAPVLGSALPPASGSL